MFYQLNHYGCLVNILNIKFLFKNFSPFISLWNAVTVIAIILEQIHGISIYHLFHVFNLNIILNILSKLMMDGK